MLRRNLIANYVGQGWTALMGLAFIPLYIKHLGIEAYGLIGLFALLQACLGVLDMGMTPTLNREIARFTGGSRSAQSIRDLLRTVEFIAVGVAILIAGGVALGSDWIATNWLQAETLPTEMVGQAFTVMGWVTALRFLEGIYRSTMVGLQRQVLFNMINSTMATVRGVGASAVLILIAPTLEAFFLWQGAISVITLTLLATAAYRYLPRVDHGACFSIASLRSIRRFAAGMMGISILSFLLMQLDKVTLSRLLSLPDFGDYMLAATVSGTLFMVVQPIVQAWFPRMNQLHACRDYSGFLTAYHQASQLVSVTLGSAAILLIVFADEILAIWLHDPALVGRTALLVRLLALGNLLNALMFIPYQAQLVYGWTGLSLRINLVAVSVILPVILWAVPLYGGKGAAWAWVVLNLAYLLIGIHLMYRKILKTEKWSWYINDLIQPLSAATVTALVFDRLIYPALTPSLASIVILMSAGACTVIVAATAAPTLRFHISRKIW